MSVLSLEGPIGAMCIDHEPVPEAKFEALRGRYGDNPIGFVAELAKVNHERRLMHEVLSAVGVPDKTAENKDLCLLGRLAILAERVRVEPVEAEEEPCDECDGFRWPVEKHDVWCSLYS